MATVHINADCNSVVAHLPGVIGAVAAKAAEGAARASAILAGHHHEGLTEITVTHGAVDSFVNLVDRSGGKANPAAAAIEFGHTTPKGHPVQGIHAISSAF